jgi:hypothetical protein
MSAPQAHPPHQTGGGCGFPGAAGELSIDDWDPINRITTEKVSHITEDGKTRHNRKFQCLHKTQHQPILPDSRKTVVNLSKVSKEAACLALSKGLNYAVTLAVVSVEGILYGVEKVLGALPKETAEEVFQENVRILKGFCEPN